MTGLPLGKLPNDLLAGLLNEIAANDHVVVGPGVGHDVAVISPTSQFIAIETDPITFASDSIGWYAININANDIATSGATPKFFLATLLFPPKTTPEKIKAVFVQLQQAAERLGVSVIGGHTEITDAVTRTIASGTMIGEVDHDRLVQPSGLKPADVILLTKGPAIEATSIIAREMPDRLRAASLSDDIIEEAANFLHSPGISVLPDAKTAMDTAPIHAMHDPTEGGVATALWEMAIASDVGMQVDVDALRADETTSAVCEAVGIDPLGAISSGALLIGLAESDSQSVVRALVDSGISVETVATVSASEKGMVWTEGAAVVPWPMFERDEIARLFEQGAK